MISEKEARHIISDNTHPDGSRTIEFRSDTSFNTKKRIAKRFKGSTLYSDGRLEIPSGAQKMERTK